MFRSAKVSFSNFEERVIFTLSLHSTVIPPRFWIESKRLTMAFFLARAKAPLARFALTMAGSISGTRPTATDTLKRAACPQFPVTLPLITKTCQVSQLYEMESGNTYNGDQH